MEAEVERFVRRRLLATVVFGAILVGGCGGATVTTAPSLAGPVATSSGAPAGFSGDPCTLLTDAEVTAATGLPVVSKQAGPQMGLFNTGCDWEVGAPNQVPWSVQLGVMASGGRSYYDQYFARSRARRSPASAMQPSAAMPTT
jgi:hypothetical protein